MSAPFSPNDFSFEPISRSNQISVPRLRRQHDDLRALMDDVARMVEGRQTGDAGFTGAGCRTTLASIKNALENYWDTVLSVEAEVTPVQALPVAKPFGRRRSADAALPAVVSTGSL